MADVIERVAVELPEGQDIVDVDIVMSRTEDGRWGSNPKARLREDISDWLRERKLQVYVQYPFDGRTLHFETHEAAMLFKLTWL